MKPPKLIAALAIVVSGCGADVHNPTYRDSLYTLGPKMNDLCLDAQILAVRARNGNYDSLMKLAKLKIDSATVIAKQLHIK